MAKILGKNGGGGQGGAAGGRGGGWSTDVKKLVLPNFFCRIHKSAPDKGCVTFSALNSGLIGNLKMLNIGPGQCPSFCILHEQVI